MKRLSVILAVVALAMPGCQSEPTLNQVRLDVEKMHPERAYEYLLDRAQRADRVGGLLEEGDIQGFVIMAESVVIGLNGRGTERVDPALKNELLKLMPYDIPEAAKVLKSTDSAPVRISAYIPPFVQKDDKLDITVTAYDRNVNLEGGLLVRTPLKHYVKPVGNVDRDFVTRAGLMAAGIWADGGGVVTLTPALVGGEARATSTPIVGYVAAGALVSQTGTPALVLKRADPYTSLLVERMVAQRFPKKASAIYTGMMAVAVPPEYIGDWKRFIDIVRRIDLRPVRSSEEIERRIETEIKRLEDQRPAERYDAECCLEAYGPLAMPALVRVLNSRSANVRQAAMRILARLKSPDVVDQLIAESRSAGGEFRVEAARLLGMAVNTPVRPVVERLVQMLADPDPLVRYSALMSLEKLRVEGTGVVAYYSLQKNFIMHLAPVEGEKCVVVKARDGVRRIDLFGTGIKIKPPFRASVGSAEVVAGNDGVAVRLKYRPDLGPVGTPELDLQVLVARLDRLEVSVNEIVAVIAELSKAGALNAKVVWVD